MRTLDPTMKLSLDRFITAQNNCYAQVIKELGQGRKTSHWIWFIFPQIQGLGFSDNSIYFGIRNLDEARAYWKNVLLRSRYEECLQLVVDSNKSPEQVLGGIDASKLQSSITLFLEVDVDSTILNDAINTLFHGIIDNNTIMMLDD